MQSQTIQTLKFTEGSIKGSLYITDGVVTQCEIEVIHEGRGINRLFIDNEETLCNVAQVARAMLLVEATEWRTEIL